MAQKLKLSVLEVSLPEMQTVCKNLVVVCCFVEMSSLIFLLSCKISSFKATWKCQSCRLIDKLTIVLFRTTTRIKRDEWSLESSNYKA